MSINQQQAFALLVQRPHLLQAHVDKDAGGCWPCSLSKNKSGYPSIRIGTTSVLAHRASYLLSNGPFDLSLSVCHSCDTPSCCNPAHLFVGTHSENMADMREKNRRKGIGTHEQNGRAKLTKAKAKQIRADRASGRLLRELAIQHEVGISTIARVCKKENWA